MEKKRGEGRAIQERNVRWIFVGMQIERPKKITDRGKINEKYIISYYLLKKRKKLQGGEKGGDKGE